MRYTSRGLVDLHPPSFPRVLRTPALLVGVYLVSTVFHLWFLRGSFRFPQTSSDEMKFVSTGESIRMGRGFTRRGEFNSTDPPVIPAFIALAHSVGPDPRLTMFVLSSFLMCSVVFPAFALGKAFGLDTSNAVILAAAATVLPHTFYAASYMEEIAEYPAYLAAFYLGIRWLERPGWRMDVALGCAMAFLSLTKMQGNLFAVAFVIACVVIVAHSLRTGFDRNRVRHAAVVLLIAAAIQAPWYLYKAAHRGTAFGLYAVLLSSKGLPHFTAGLTTAYFVDFLLAPGLITGVLLCYWIRHNGNYPRTVFVLAFLAVQIVVVSIKEGGQSGLLRERLFFYALPMMAILAAAGLVHFKKRQTFLPGCGLLAAPLVLTGALAAAYPFPLSPIMDVPWANALGTLAGTVAFSRLWLMIAVLTLCVLIASLLLRTSRSAPLLFGVYILLFYGLGFVCSSFGLAVWATQGLRTVSPILSWLSANHVRSGDRLLIAGTHSGYQDPSRPAGSPDERFINWNRQLGLTDPLQWQLETIGRFDIRKIQAPAVLMQESHPGDYLLTTAVFDGLDLRSFHYPFYLYRVDSALMDAPSPRYMSYIPPDRFYTLAGRRDSAGVIVGMGGRTEGYLVYGPYLDLSPGRYSVKFSATDNAGALSFDVATEGGRKILARISATPAQLGSIVFVNHSAARVEFRIFGASDSMFRFNGVNLEWLSDGARE